MSKQYKSVIEMVYNTASPEFAIDFEKYLIQRQLSKALICCRIKAGLTEIELAQRMNEIMPFANYNVENIEDMEISLDSDLKLGDVQLYLKAIGMVFNWKIVIKE